MVCAILVCVQSVQPAQHCPVVHDPVSVHLLHRCAVEEASSGEVSGEEGEGDVG